MVAASGNDGSPVSDYPAIDPTVLGVGGIEPSGTLWSGSNYDPDQFVMPATDVLSTFYRGIAYSPTGGCDDSLLPAYPGYGPCSGTSMAAPAMTGLAGLLRSVNPLVEKGQIRDLLLANLDNPPGWNPAHGHGKPDALLAVQDALGRVDGQVLPNRLTPLFRLYSESPRDTMLTTVPQWASVARQGGLGATYFTTGRRVTGYNDFPGVICYWSWCVPTADVYVLTTDRSPNGHPLVPLYRMSRRGGKLDHNYTTEAAGIVALADRGFQVDGVEGYVYKRCSPEPSCMPPGTVRLYRYYNPTLDDHALFPETDIVTWTAAGYGPEAGANEWIGYVYLNQDSDGDEAIDGFENLIGTNPNHADSDCDGTTDGDEIVWFSYSDPLDGPCGGGSQVIGEVGQVTDISHLSRTVYFSRSYQNPVVFAQPLSFNGQQQAVIRITNVGTSGFTFYLQEAPDMDGPHVQETVSWVVLEAGSWQLANGVELEVGQIVTDRTLGTNVAGSWQTVTFGQDFTSELVNFWPAVASASSARASQGAATQA